MPAMDNDIELSWFEAGSEIFDGIIDDPGGFPPLDDRLALREWLTGFAGAWAELATYPPIESGEDLRQRDPDQQSRRPARAAAATACARR